MISQFLKVMAAALLLQGCVVAQRVDSAFDCNGVCERYSACFDKQYDVSACAARCRRSASEDPDYRRKADVCAACITERSCTSATFNCAGECGAVVP